MITVMFSCDGCGLKDHKIQVPARETAEEDVRIWMAKLGGWIGEEHQRLSPNCKSMTMKDLKIPLKHTDGTEAEFLGQQLE